MPAGNQEKSARPHQFPDYSTMNWTIEYVEEGHFVRVSAAGIYNMDDHMRMLEDVVTRDFWKPGMNVLIDNSSLDFSQTSLEQLRAAGRKRIEHDALIGCGKTAVLVGTLAGFARARQFELITSGKVSAKIDIFNDEEKAIKWLLA